MKSHGPKGLQHHPILWVDFRIIYEATDVRTNKKHLGGQCLPLTIWKKKEAAALCPGLAFTTNPPCTHWFHPFLGGVGVAIGYNLLPPHWRGIEIAGCIANQHRLH